MSVLTVGSGGEFSTITEAVAASHDGDIVKVQAGTYVNDFPTVSSKISIEGVGGIVQLVATVPPPDGKAILTVNTDLVLSNFEISGAANPSLKVVAYVNGFFYGQARPLPPEEIPLRFARAEEVWERKVWREQIKEWNETGQTADLTDLATKEGWDKTVAPELLPVMKPTGNWVAVPMNIHRINWTWASSKAMAGEPPGQGEPTALAP